jgi:histidinol-phosphate aminotransferase
MQGYTPGEQPASPRAIKLNTNENPYPPCDAVMGALQQVPAEALRRYPPPHADAFRAVAAAVHGVGEDQILAVNGGDELLRLAITTFVEPGRPIGMLEPSYSLYPVLAGIHGSPVVALAADTERILPEDFAARLNAQGVQLTFVVSPHAPSGRLIEIPALTALAEALHGVLLIDEAYVDFVDPALTHDAVALVKRFDNVLLLRTLSKGYSLAGLRFGYGIGASGLIEPMRTRTRDSYNVDAIAQRLACIALSERRAAALTWEKVRAERVRVRKALLDLGCAVPESQSNFLLATLPTAREAYARLAAQEIFVRYFDQEGLRDKLRITIGTPDQNDALLEALARILTAAP